MAAKKRAPETIEATPAGKKSKSTAVAVHADWEKELMKHAQRSKKVAEENASGGGNWLTFQGGQLRYKGMDIKNNQTDLILLGGVNEFLYYDPKKKYDSENPSQPLCFAMSFEKGDMAPHEKAVKPQNSDCPSCPHNKFGTATTGSGKGKACKNQVRLAMIPWGDGTADALKIAEIGFAKIPVTSVRNWAQYESMLPKPSCYYVTRMHVAPDTKTQIQVTFEQIEGPLPKNLMQIISTRVKEAEPLLLPDDPYPPITPRERSAPTKRSGKSKY